MTNLSDHLGVLMAVFMVMTAITSYRFAGIAWKAKPWIPFLFGLCLLAGMILLNWQIDATSRRLDALHPANSHAAELVLAIVQGSQWEMKLIELIGIPLAVSLITTALSIKVEREYIEEQHKFEEHREEIDRFDRDIQKIETQLGEALKSGPPNAEVVKRWEELRSLKNQLLKEQWAIQEAFKTLIDAKLIRAEKWRRTAMRAVIAPPPIPVGKIKSFGPFGPKYEVGPALRQLDDGDWMVEITMVETGEKAEHRFTRLSDDPEAR